jgi:hypothetical protein
MRVSGQGGGYPGVRGRLLAALLSLGLLGARGIGAEPVRPEDAEEEPPPSADEVLERVRSLLPAEPVVLEGSLEVRRRHGVPVGELDFRLEADWGGRPARMTGVLFDSDGRQVDALQVEFLPGEAPAIRREKPPAGDVLADLADVTWADLTLAFLWWPGAQHAGQDTLRGRACTLVDIPTPPWAARTLGADFARLRVWVDDEAGFLMQTESFGADGTRRRRLWVRSLKKVDGRWMIKDMEVQGYPAVQRTRVRIRAIVGPTE